MLSFNQLRGAVMRVKDAARIFNSSHLTQLAKGDLSLMHRVSRELLDVDPHRVSLSQVFDSVYSELSKHYRYEYFFKNTIANKLLLGTHSLNTATLLTEFRVGQNIADCVLINGVSTCYEIKTDYDSLLRLEEQLESYSRLFDKVYVVADEKFIDDVCNVVPEHVGVIKLTAQNRLSKIKEAHDLSQQDIDLELVMRSLRAPEYKELTQRLVGEIPDVGNTKMFTACQNLLDKCDPKAIRDQYRKILKSSRKNNASLLNALPKSLINAGISYKLTINLQNRLLSILNTSANKELICTTRFSEENSSSF